MYKKAQGMDGRTYDSQAEAVVADWLLAHEIEYEPHKRLPPPSRQICDFYLPTFDLWIEYDGLMEVRADDKLRRKEEFYIDNGLKYVIVNRNNWESELFAAIFVA